MTQGESRMSQQDTSTHETKIEVRGVSKKFSWTSKGRVEDVQALLGGNFARVLRESLP